MKDAASSKLQLIDFICSSFFQPIAQNSTRSKSKVSRQPISYVASFLPKAHLNDFSAAAACWSIFFPAIKPLLIRLWGLITAHHHVTSKRSSGTLSLRRSRCIVLMAQDSDVRRMRHASTIWKLPTGNVFHTLSATNASFRFEGNPLIVTRSTVTKNIVTVRFLNAIPSVQRKWIEIEGLHGKTPPLKQHQLNRRFEVRSFEWLLLTS